ncbi:ribose 5-phosphate isomerase B [bacterium]|jgi:ribose 5-phosphate isomerase B|nr:ribose 5-phosphate isomerase B [bacterium]MBT3581364.1 ribose 5-phosphate isomerase B [bacterium]MBT4552097.1 ribose 5-phosphate isomerase B [bacterium]MBT5988372.1 ribose 5-phosphate isomerase B [bacterium]MBT7088372.1 ribose 5-phosphate isomerase B [bacterium]
MQKIFLGSDHGGFELRNTLKQYLQQTRKDIEIEDMGVPEEISVDYPDYALKVVKKVLKAEDHLGILVCGTGIGMSMMANRFKKIRAALVHNEFTAQMAKQHNNANILCLGARTTEAELAKKLVDIWLDSEFEAGRHTRRIAKLDDFLG